MTVATTDQASPWAEFGNAGLEDVNARDLQLPRLKINGPECALREHGLEREVPGAHHDLPRPHQAAGLLRRHQQDPRGFTADLQVQRLRGRLPERAVEQQVAGLLPVDRVRLQPADRRPDGSGPRSSASQGDTCQLKEWRNGERPECSELHTYPVLDSHPDTHELIPAILTVKSSAIKNSRNLVSAFSTANRPMFTAWTRVTLTGGKRGSVVYAVPNFAPLFDMAQITPQDMWKSWYEQWKLIRDAQRMPPRPFEDEDGNPIKPPEPAVSGNLIAGEASPWQDYQDAAPNQNGTVEWPPPAPAAQAPAPPVAAAPVTTPPPAAQPPAAPPSPSHGRVAPPSAMSEPVAPVQAPPVTPTAPPAPPVAPVAPPVAPPVAAPAPPQAQAAPIAPPAAPVAEAPDDLPF